MTDDQINGMFRAISFLAASIVMSKVEKVSDAGAMAQLEQLKDYFLRDIKGEPMKAVPRPDATKPK
jgi:hypothetical protein